MDQFRPSDLSAQPPAQKSSLPIGTSVLEESVEAMSVTPTTNAVRELYSSSPLSSQEEQSGGDNNNTVQSGGQPDRQPQPSSWSSSPISVNVSPTDSLPLPPTYRSPFLERYLTSNRSTNEWADASSLLATWEIKRADGTSENAGIARTANTTETNVVKEADQNRASQIPPEDAGVGPSRMYADTRGAENKVWVKYEQLNIFMAERLKSCWLSVVAEEVEKVPRPTKEMFLGNRNGVDNIRGRLRAIFEWHHANVRIENIKISQEKFKKYKKETYGEVVTEMTYGEVVMRSAIEARKGYIAKALDFVGGEFFKQYAIKKYEKIAETIDGEDTNKSGKEAQGLSQELDQLAENIEIFEGKINKLIADLDADKINDVDFQQLYEQYDKGLYKPAVNLKKRLGDVAGKVADILTSLDQRGMNEFEILLVSLAIAAINNILTSIIAHRWLWSTYAGGFVAGYAANLTVSVLKGQKLWLRLLAQAGVGQAANIGVYESSLHIPFLAQLFGNTDGNDG